VKAGEPSEAWSFVDSSVVLANRFDCRSRRATRGAERSRAMSPRKRRCLATRLREAKKRRKPVLDGKVQERVAGSRPRFRESGAERALVGGRHPEPGKPLSFDEAAAEAVLVESKGFRPAGFRRHGMSEVDSHSPLAAENAVTEERRTKGPSIGGAHQERAALEPTSKDEGSRARVFRSW
jgi:hypothetical protein